MRVLLFILSLICTSAQLLFAVEVEWVAVGDPNNLADSDTSFGAVAYEYRIGKFEITATQYSEFLNAVATDDKYHLYSERENDNWTRRSIVRSGEPGSYTYQPEVGADFWPANHITFWEAARFANWMHNGQPTGSQDSTTTEDGAYTLIPEAITDNSVARNPRAKFFIPSEDEWYKAAFYKGGGTNTGYWNYPTQSDVEPIAAEPSGSPNTANHDNAVHLLRRGVFSSVPSNVGSYFNSPGPYGTFDQAGNEWEWTELIINDVSRRLRGASFFFNGDDSLSRETMGGFRAPDTATSVNGFRLASLMPFLQCDFDGSHFCDGPDIDLLMNEAATGGHVADLTGDGVVNNADRDEWLALAGAANGFSESLLVGDSNLDGTVNAIDLNEVGINWQRQDVFNWTDGNFSLEGEPGVNSIDLNALATNWQQALASAAAVPEPPAFGLLLLATMLGTTIRRRQTRFELSQV